MTDRQTAFQLYIVENTNRYITTTQRHGYISFILTVYVSGISFDTSFGRVSHNRYVARQLPESGVSFLSIPLCRIVGNFNYGLLIIFKVCNHDIVLLIIKIISTMYILQVFILQETHYQPI